MEWDLNEHSNLAASTALYSFLINGFLLDGTVQSPDRASLCGSWGQNPSVGVTINKISSAVQAEEMKTSNTPAGLVIFQSLKVMRTLCFYSVLRLILPAIFTCWGNVFNDSREEAVCWITNIQTWRTQLLSVNLNIIKRSLVLFIRHGITTWWDFTYITVKTFLVLVFYHKIWNLQPTAAHCLQGLRKGSNK